MNAAALPQLIQDCFRKIVSYKLQGVSEDTKEYLKEQMKKNGFFEGSVSAACDFESFWVAFVKQVVRRFFITPEQTLHLFSFLRTDVKFAVIAAMVKMDRTPKTILSFLGKLNDAELREFIRQGLRSVLYGIEDGLDGFKSDWREPVERWNQALDEEDNRTEGVALKIAEQLLEGDRELMRQVFEGGAQYQHNTPAAQQMFALTDADLVNDALKEIGAGSEIGLMNAAEFLCEKIGDPTVIYFYLFQVRYEMMSAGVDRFGAKLLLARVAPSYKFDSNAAALVQFFRQAE